MKKFQKTMVDDPLKGALSFANTMNANAATNAPKDNAVAVGQTNGMQQVQGFTPMAGAGRLDFGVVPQNFRSYLDAVKDGARIEYLKATAPGSVNGVFSPSMYLKNANGTFSPSMYLKNGLFKSDVDIKSDTGEAKDTDQGAEKTGDAQVNWADVLKAADARDALEPRKKTFEEWMATDGYDTETDFQNAKAQLEYEMQTWRANYGANAERLAQMGLSNAGVVDIYGTGVIQAYATAMNDLYLEKIAADRENQRLYEEYSNNYEAEKAAKTETFNNNVTAAYAYGLELYDMENLEAVTTMMSNAGYDDDVVAQAAARLSAVDPSMLPALQAQAQQDQADINTAIDQLMKSGYKPEMAESAANIYRAKGWSEEKIAKVIQGANGLAGMQSAGQSATGDQTLIAGVDAVKALFYDDGGNYLYTGSEAQKESIKQSVRGTKYEAMADQIIAQMDADLAQMKSAAAADTVKKIEAANVKDLSVSNMASDLGEAATRYGVDSDEYAMIQKAYSDKIVGALTDVFEYDSDLEPLRSLIGVDEEQWATMDDSDKVGAIFDELGKLHKDGHMTDEAYYSMTDKLVDNEIGGVMKQINKRSLRELSDVLLQVKGLVNSGYIDNAKYNEYRGKIANSIDEIGTEVLVDENGEFYGINIEVILGGIKIAVNAVASDDPVDKAMYDQLNKSRNGEYVFAHQGKLYAYISPNVIVPIDSIEAKGQGRGSNVQLSAMYEIIAKYIYDYDN